jgi:hypothetical protein
VTLPGMIAQLIGTMECLVAVDEVALEFGRAVSHKVAAEVTGAAICLVKPRWEQANCFTEAGGGAVKGVGRGAAMACCGSMLVAKWTGAPSKVGITVWKSTAGIHG